MVGVVVVVLINDIAETCQVVIDRESFVSQVFI